MNGQFARTHSATIRASIDMTLAAVHGSLVKAELSYRTMDPFAVSIVFSVADCPAVEWVCARDLLREGLAMSAGTGDVRVHPLGEHLVVELLSPHGSAQLIASHGDVAEFVARMFQAVPEGRESEHFSFDSELEYLV